MSSPHGSDRGWEAGLGWSLDDSERAERVEQIKAEVEAGEYRIPAEAVADAVLQFYRRSPEDGSAGDSA